MSGLFIPGLRRSFVAESDPTKLRVSWESFGPDCCYVATLNSGKATLNYGKATLDCGKAMLDYEKSNVEFRISNVKSTLNYERHQWPLGWGEGLLVW